MPGLLSCPNEVLLQIIGDLSHGGLENFAVTCKRGFNLSADAIAEKKKKYSTITCGQTLDNGSINGVHPFFTLREVLLDDSIAVYPTKMLIGRLDGDRSWSTEVETIKEITRHALDLEDLISSAMENYSLTFKDSEKRHKKKVMDGKSSAATRLLITMCPNLRSIDIYTSFTDDSYCPRMISELSSSPQSENGRANDFHLQSTESEYSMRARTRGHALEEMKSSQACRKLCYLKVVGNGDGLGIYAPLSRIASLRTLSGTYLDDVGFFRVYPLFPAEPIESTISKIEFEKSMISSERIEVLVRNMVCVQHFKYRYSEFFGGDAEWQPYDIIRSLSRHLHHCLLSLDLTGGPRTVAKRYGTGLISCLKDFQVLQTIRLDNTVFKDNERTRYAWRRTYCPHYHEIPSSTADLFPATVESLTLAQPFRIGVVQELLGDFPKQKNAKFPKLREIVFENKPGLEEELEKALRNAGITLRLPQEEGTRGGCVAIEPNSREALAEASKDSEF
ncbi:MAG: hypothetical protein ALECFALPRED_006869 [Alectoria fallacina]|uniref:F-box domain-containing protein n=1 Tax=Alectoria fallacina TaxID=1903189 RepID=A0A8H3GB70_9LECA|nr:MAG: hypothetical protein ALECFALPRED_006869 [Alectoria fallacina]